MSGLYTHSKVRVVVVDDSAVVRELLSEVLAADGHVQVVGCARDGLEAVETVQRSNPDVVTMDVNMPHMSGLEATRRIMETHPVPIVIVTGCSRNMETAEAFRLLEAGALAVIAKPAGPGHPGHERAVRDLLQTIKSMAEVRVIRRWPRAVPSRGAAPVANVDDKLAARAAAGMSLVVIGASTGGPVALNTILSGLPRDFPVPVLIVQHIADGFAGGLADWLRQASGFDVRLACAGDVLKPGVAYLAPDGMHMRIVHGNSIALDDGQPENGHRPSVSHLFRSVADSLGPRAVGVLLTGMGKDGAMELRRMRERGALTIAQDERSSVVHGMPGHAIELDAASHVLAPFQIAEMLAHLAKQRNRSR